MKRDQGRSDQYRIVALTMAVLLSLASFARASAQEITVALGDGSTVGATPQDTVVVPMNVRFAAGSSENLASLAFSVTWDTARVVYDSAIAVAANVIINRNAVSNGQLDAVWFAPTGQTSDFPVMALRMITRATPGFTGVNVAVSTAGNETGQSILSSVGVQPVGICIGTGALLGDVNDDGEIDIIDAQQIARYSVGLSVTNPDLVGARGDVNRDGAADIIDAQQVARYVVGLEVTSAVGEKAGSVCTGPPAATITAPDEDSAFASGQAITFQGSAADPEDGALGGSNLVWSSSIDGQFGTGSTVTTGVLSAGDHTVTLTATDGDGNTGSATVNISVGTGTAFHLVFTRQPSAFFPARYPSYPPVEVEVRDAGGHCAPGYTGLVLLALGANPGGAQLTGGGPVSPTGCTYSFPDLVISEVGQGYTLVAVSDSLPSVASDSFQVSIPGDLNGDGTVDVTDIGILLSNWGRTDYPPADINKDGLVDLLDLNILKSHYLGLDLRTGSVSDVTASGAVLNGWVTSPLAVNVWFEWGTNADLSSYSTTPPTALSAGDSIPLSASIAGLVPEQTYYFRLAAESGTDTARSDEIASFSTPPAGGAHLSFLAEPADVLPPDNVFPAGFFLYPAVRVEVLDQNDQRIVSFTGRVNLTTGSGPDTLNGGGPVDIVNGVARFDSVWTIEVGSGYTLVAHCTGLSSITSQPFIISIPGDIDVDGCVDQDDLDTVLSLWGNAGAYTRADINKDGIVDVLDLSRVISNWTAPGVSELDTANVTSTTVTFSGNANPNGNSSTAWFEWSTDSNFAAYDSTNAAEIGSGTEAVQISEDVSGLQAGTTYYVRMVAMTADGCSVRGNVLSFTTQQQLGQVRVLYLVPQDRTVRSDYADAVASALTNLQEWFEAQLAGPTFLLFTAAPEVCHLPQTADYYAVDSWTKVFNDVQSCAPVAYGSNDFVWMLYVDVVHACNAPGRLGAAADGVAMLPRQDLDGLIGAAVIDDCGTALDQPIGRWIGGAGHELGHAFGLPHPPGCDDNLPTCDYNALMWAGYVNYPDTYLRPEEKEALLATAFFR